MGCNLRSTYSISRHDLTLDRRIGIVESVEEVWVGEQSAEDALVIPYRRVSVHRSNGHLHFHVVVPTEQHETKTT